MLFLNKFDIFEQKILKVSTFNVALICVYGTVFSHLRMTSHGFRFPSILVNGLKITRQFQQENKRLSMLMSKLFHVQYFYKWRGCICWALQEILVFVFPLTFLFNSCAKWSILYFDDVHFRFVKKKFEESYFQSTAPDCVDRVFKIYRTTALDPKLVKKTFKLVDETLRRRNLFEAGLLWNSLNIQKQKCSYLERCIQVLT